VQNLSLVDTCGTVTIMWDPIPTATIYRVLRHRVGSAEWGSIETLNDTVTTDQPGVGTWEYQIIAGNDCGEGAASDIEPITIIPALAQVVNVTATTDSCNCVYLTWDDVDNETDYEIFCNGNFVGVTFANDTTFAHCDSVNALDCNYVINANNSCDMSPPSVPVHGSSIVAPGQVQGVSATDDGCDGITITWTPLTAADGYSIFVDSDSLTSVTAPLMTRVKEPTPTPYVLITSAAMA
jgi:hypothetical protein